MKVLIISVHPDDETLGCGGTILKHKRKGDELYWLVITGVSEKEGFTAEFVQGREEQISKVFALYGFKRVYKLGFPTTKLHVVDLNVLMTAISNVVTDIMPELVYTVNRSDIHTDHQIAAKAVASCTKSFRYPFIKKILMYECVSETEIAPALPENLFIPGVYSDISDFIEKKLEIMNIYASEVQQPPLPRSLENIRALARYRGSSVSVPYAEAFMLVRELF